MPNKSQSIQSEGPTLGSRLREAREALGLAEEDIADYLRLEKNIVTKIEHDQLQPEELTVFVRGYIRAYAKYVNFPIDEVDAYFVKQGLLKPALNLSPAKFELDRSKLQRKKVNWITLIVIAILAIFVLSWVFVQRPDKVLLNTSEPNSATPANTVQPAIPANTGTPVTNNTAISNVPGTPALVTPAATDATTAAVVNTPANTATVSSVNEAQAVNAETNAPITATSAEHMVQGTSEVSAPKKIESAPDNSIPAFIRNEAAAAEQSNTKAAASSSEPAQAQASEAQVEENNTASDANVTHQDSTTQDSSQSSSETSTAQDE